MVKIILIFGKPQDWLIQQGNSGILHQEQNDIILELMGLQQNGQQYQQNNLNDDEDVHECKFITDAKYYNNISNGIRTILITEIDQYKEFNIETTPNYDHQLLSQYDLFILTKDNEQVLDDIKQQEKYHIFYICDIPQREIQLKKPLQSFQQYKFEKVDRESKQLALVHYSNFSNRVDKLKCFKELEDVSHYIRNNAMRVNCLWREFLSLLGKFPKYGA